MKTTPAFDRSPEFILTKIIRISSWPLLAVVVLFLATGYAMSGQYGFGTMLEAKQALALHKLFHGLLLALVLVHALPGIYLAVKRWKLIQ